MSQQHNDPIVNVVVEMTVKFDLPIEEGESAVEQVEKAISMLSVSHDEGMALEVSHIELK